MAQPALVRIDSRLIHGQVVTQWIRNANANRVIIIDNQIMADPFMAQIFIMASPPGIKLDLMSTKMAAEQWQKDQFGQGTIIVLMKDIQTMEEVYKKGFKFTKLQLGGLGGAPGRVAVAGPITLSETDAKILSEMEKADCKIVLQITPNTPEISWQSVKSKYFSKL